MSHSGSVLLILGLIAIFAGLAFIFKNKKYNSSLVRKIFGVALAAVAFVRYMYATEANRGMIAVDGKSCTFVAVVMSGDNTAETVVRKSVMNAKASESLVCEKFVDVKEDRDGRLERVKFKNTDTFNFGFTGVRPHK